MVAGDFSLSAAVYTELTDVEAEINGQLTYDRRVVKVSKVYLQSAVACAVAPFTLALHPLLACLLVPSGNAMDSSRPAWRGCLEVSWAAPCSKMIKMFMSLSVTLFVKPHRGRLRSTPTKRCSSPQMTLPLPLSFPLQVNIKDTFNAHQALYNTSELINEGGAVLNERQLHLALKSMAEAPKSAQGHAVGEATCAGSP